jgi:hypothetical protein
MIKTSWLIYMEEDEQVANPKVQSTGNRSIERASSSFYASLNRNRSNTRPILDEYMGPGRGNKQYQER